MVQIAPIGVAWNPNLVANCGEDAVLRIKREGLPGQRGENQQLRAAASCRCCAFVEYCWIVRATPHLIAIRICSLPVQWGSLDSVHVLEAVELESGQRAVVAIGRFV